jgi:hypothetical protein
MAMRVALCLRQAACDAVCTNENSSNPPVAPAEGHGRACQAYSGSRRSLR